MRAPINRTTAAVAATALLAGLIGTVVPSAANADPAQVGPIETVGPIATVGGVGQAAPTLPIGLAQMPRGGVMNPESPYLQVPALRSSGEVPVRVVETGRDLQVWSGTLTAGWARVGATLAYAREYRVEVRGASDAWTSVGTLSVAPRGAGAGASVDAAGIKVSVVSGQVTTSWESPRLAGPVGGAGVGLSWGTNAVRPVPGLAPGWQLSAQPGRWALLSEAGDVTVAQQPGSAVAVRAPGASVASVTLRYPSSAARWVSRWLVQRKVGSGPWATVPLSSVRQGRTQVTGRVTVPSTGSVQLRVGARVEETTLWGPATLVVPSAPVASIAALTPRPLVGAGTRSLLTPGNQPQVVRLTGWDGTQLTFVRNGLGVYEQAGGAVTGYANRLSWIADNRWEMADADGGVTAFVNGRAASFTSKGALMARYTWDTAGRLTEVRNEIGRALDLRYSGTDECPSSGWTGSGFASAPDGLLCQIAYPDGTTTEIGYVVAGSTTQVGLIKDPGNTGTAYGWDDLGRLSATRSHLVSRAATVDNSVAGLVTRLSYSADGRVSSIVDAPASPNAPTVTRTIAYPIINDAALRDWATNPVVSNAAGAVVRIDAGDSYGDLPTSYRIDPITWRTVARTDARGLTASTGRSSTDTGNLASSRDATGRETTYAYNELGEVTSVAGPVEPGNAGAKATTTYDTARTSAGVDDPMSGLRALVYSGTGFTGAVSPQFLKADYSRGALSATWTGRPTEFSAQAAGVWNPSSDAQDAAGRANGWQFSVTASGGTDAEFVVGGNVCAEGTTCVVTGLPTGPKSVSVQVRRAGTSGWLQVLAAPVGQRLAPLPADDVRPGFGLTTVAKSNDDLPGGPTDGSETRYTYANPATSSTTAVTEAGGLTTSITHESSSAGNGSWGRLLTVTTPGGRTQTTDYWGDDVDEALPDVCGGAVVRQSGQARTVTRYDGTTLSTWYDLAGRVRAQVSAGGSETQTTCTEYFDDGDPRSVSTFASDGALLEKVTTNQAVDGNPRVTAVTIEHGPAAPVSPNTTVTTLSTVDLLGRTVAQTDIGGASTAVTYDALGSMLIQSTTPPAGAGSAPLVIRYAYSPVNARLTSVSVNGQTAATVSYAGDSGRIARVDYPDGVSASFAYLPNGTLGTVSARTGDSALGSVIETRTQSAYGRVSSAKVRSTGTGGYAEARGYTFDTAGRLSRAVIATANGTAPDSASFGYSYGPQDASCPAGYPNAGKDGLRTGGTLNGTPYVVCHDASGRLTSTASPLVTGDSPALATYDSLGRMTGLGGDRSLSLTWGADGKPAIIAESGSGGDITTTLDTFAGTVRDKSVASGTGTSTVRYAGPFRVSVDALGGSVTGTESLQYGLPGGATVTQRTGQQAVLTIPGADGSALVEVPVPTLGTGSAVGARIADRFGPYGEPLVEPAANTARATPTYSWRAAQRAETLAGTSSITLLPARAYHPLLGEFLSLDPVLDAANNGYSYTNGDPVNTADPTGGETDDTTTTALLSAASLGGALVAFLGGFSYTRFAGMRGSGAISKVLLNKGPRMSRGIVPNYAIASAAVTAIGSAGAGYAAYAAAKSQNTDEAASIGAAVGASLLSLVGAFGAAKWGLNKRVKELGYKPMSRKQFRAAQQEKLLAPNRVSSFIEESPHSSTTLSPFELNDAELAYRRGSYVEPHVLEAMKNEGRVSVHSFAGDVGQGLL